MNQFPITGTNPCNIIEPYRLRGAVRGKTAPLEKKQQDAFNANQKLSGSVGNRQLLQPYGCPAHPNLSANSKN